MTTDTTDQRALPVPSTGARCELSRRGLLRGLGVAGLGALLGPALLRPDTAEAAAPNRAARRAAARQRPTPTTTAAKRPPNQPKGRRRLGDGSAATQPTPYYVQASCELSEDYFLTDDVIIGADDQIVAFINPFNNNLLEAIVLSNGTLCHLRRDLTASSGWSYEAIVQQSGIDNPFDTVTQVCVVADGSDVFLLAFGTPDAEHNPYLAPAWITWLTSADTWNEGLPSSAAELGVPSAADLGPIKAGMSSDGNPYFYTTVTTGTTVTIQGWTLSTQADNPLTPITFLSLDMTEIGTELSEPTPTVEDVIVLYNADAADQVGYALVLTSDGDLCVYPQIDQPKEVFYGTPLTDTGARGVTALLWAWATPNSDSGTPGFAVQTGSTTGFVDENGNSTQLSDQAATGDNTISVWTQGGLWTVNLLDSNGTLYMAQQTSGAGTGTWATPLPFVPGLSAIYGVPTDPSQSTLIAVGADETLSVLSLDASGWTQTKVHQDGATLQEVGSYRVQASVLDTNGTGVFGGQVQVSTDRPVGFWQASGNTIVTPDTPVKMTADAKGDITFSIPAEELDAAVLTLQALDPSGNPTGAPFTVTPDTDVHGFLGGSGSLSGPGSLTGSTLLAAQNADGTPLLPTLTNLPSDQQAGVAGTVAQAMNNIVAVGTTAAPSGTDAVQSMKLDLTGAAPTFQTSLEADTFDSVSASRLELSFSHLFHTIGHALRHAAAQLKTAVIKWADDTKQWIVNLAIQIGDDVVSFGNLVVNGMKEAFHVIGGFFNTLGADIKKAIDWLKRNVIELLKEAGANAATIQGWLTQAPDQFATVLKSIETGVDKYFSTKEADAHTLISNVETYVEDVTFGSAAPLPPPTDDTGSSGSQSALVKDMGAIGKVMNDAPARWLLDKLLSFLPSDPGPQLDDVVSVIIDDLAHDWADAITFSENVRTLLQDTASDAFSTKGAVTQTKMTDWFMALDQCAHDGLLLLDDVADTVLDLVTAVLGVLGDYLTYEYQVFGKDSIIGLVLDLAGVDISLSISHLVSLSISYPATLISRIRGNDTLFPASTAAVGSKARHALGDAPDGWQVGLGICAAVTQGLWGMADIIGDISSFADPNSGKRGTAPGAIDYFDILCPIAETAFLWPSQSFSDGSTAPPWHGFATNTKDWQLLPPTIYTAILPSCFGIAAKIKSKTAGTTTGGQLPTGVEDPFADYYGPMIQCIAGLANTALGAAYSASNSLGGSAIAGGVLGNLSFVLAPLETWWLNESTEDVPVLIKTVVDAVGNIGAAVCIAEAASLPPK